MPRPLRAVLPLVLISFLAGCGIGNNESSAEERLRQAREQGAQEERIKQLEKEVEARRGPGGGSTTAGGSAPAPNPAPSSPSGNCGEGLTANSNTTCPFARNVKAAYGQGGSSTISAFSPALGRDVTMSCTGDNPVVCTGGNNARVTFP